MQKYELSISSSYVPEWGVTEAVREFFQNAIDEETRDASNKMFFDYDSGSQAIRIGNKNSGLDIKTLLLGVTTKDKDSDMIGNYGEGYKIATIVLLRLGKTVVFQNYCRREIWHPKLVKSKRYGGVLVPTFFVDQEAVWKQVPEHSLIIEVGGITPEEYQQIYDCNLHLQEGYSHRDTRYGAILDDRKHRGNIFVGGLFICTEPRLDIGIDFKPKVVRLERDRTMVDGFDVKWYAARMIEELRDPETTKRSLDSYSGQFITSSRVPMKLKNEIAEKFINEHGPSAVPVSTQEDMETFKGWGLSPVIVSESKRDVILESEFYKKVKEGEKARPLYDRFHEFAEKIKKRLTQREIATLHGFLDEISGLEEREG